jgi:hypothetical protein
MEEFIDIELNECIVCNDSNCNDKLIQYKHKCGRYYIHKKCLILWFKKHNNECIICREELFTENDRNKRYCCYIITLFGLFILFLFFLVVYFIIF